MALKKCKECGEEISSSASKCPKCGKKMHRAKEVIDCWFNNNNFSSHSWNVWR